ncbi:hypothetical protein GD627_11705 [Arthrobacter yangruifuii]|uniref:Lipoprotein n=1 Tax=Arthrobacter yangruifuii TaxID=2606616 RepID=A0A5N6MET2_9MICC|nr:hypothetical protein [Arthrobacter yangruifuii]KAD3514972.1 hypothetical protein GD627_11705 [Arthrobacter yangruifuii]
MLSTSKRMAVLLSTAGLISGSAVLATPAAAAGTECEPGDVKTSFNHHYVTTSKEAVSSITLSNVSGSEAPTSVTAKTDGTATASVSGPVPFDEILAPLQAQVSADASARETWTESDAVKVTGPMPAGQSRVAEYGFTIVTFSGAQQTCQLDGQFGPQARFAGTAPTGTYVENYTLPYVP